MKRTILYSSLFLIMLSLLTACKSGSGNNSDRKHAFYFWTGNFIFNSTDSLNLAKTDTEKIYVKLFEVVFEDGKPQPSSAVYFNDPVPSHLEMVPTVFITNETFKGIDSTGIDTLSQNVFLRLKLQLTGMKLWNKTEEIQFDCDWNESTRDKYFYFLQLMKNKMNKITLSCTIRLYQYKYYKKAGVPPVDKGLLMCYNVNDLRNPNNENSIFNKTDVMSYVKDISYPLNFDLALPVFSWAVRFREGYFDGLMNQFTNAYIKSDTSFVKLDKENTYKCLHDGYYKDFYVQKDEVIKIEEPNIDDVIEVKNYLANTNPDKMKDITLFSYSQQTIDKLTHEKLLEIYRTDK